MKAKMKTKTKTKWLLAATIAICVGILVAIPLYANRDVVVSTRSIPVCPPDDGNLVLLPEPNDCSIYYLCDNGVPRWHECPDGLYYCAEKQICDWMWDTDCSFNCIMK
jgi:hypothetical protein